MKLYSVQPRFILALILIATGVMFRFIPHWPNFTPVAAIALFSGAYLERKALAFVIPLAAMLLSDLILGFHDGMWAVYLAFSMTVAIGILISKKLVINRVILASFGSSLLFFLVTNFASWLGNPLYPQNFAGLAGSYAAGLVFFNNGSMGISFFLNELAGTLLYSGVLFGVAHLVSKRHPAFARAI
jgi:hypothetical protein